jgi:hypothetical protein
MGALARLQVYGVSVPQPGLPDDEIESAIKYIEDGPDYKERVKRANNVKFTYQPPHEGRWQPRRMSRIERFLNGEWRWHEWEAYDFIEKKEEGPTDHSGPINKPGVARKLILAFFGAIFLDIILAFIIWLIIMMGISELGLESKFGFEVDPMNVFIGILVVGFVLFFMGFLGLIKTK